MSSAPDGSSQDTSLVSIIVPVHNAAEFLEECLRSILAQTHTALEVILVDDASADDSLRICEEWARADPRVRVLAEEHGGASVARNHGLDVMRGAFVTFVDADDVLAPDHVDHLLGAARCTGADLVTADLAHYPSGAQPTFRPPTTVRTATPDEALARIVTSGVGFASCGKLVASAVFTDLRFTPGMPFEDLEILPRLFAKASLVAVSNGVTYGYRRYAESTEGGHLELLKSAMFGVLSSGIAVAQERHGYRSTAAARLTVGYAMQAAKMLEGAAAPGVAREPGFDRSYRQFMARNLRVLLRSADLSRTYKVALLVSVAWPAAFVTGFRVARRLKSTVAPNLRRASTAAASARRP